MRRDCLNTIRLLAALQVALPNHAVSHLHTATLVEPFNTLLNFLHGIPVFFTLSGFLIWMSIGRSTSFGQYCQKRFWRIYPELWVAVALEIVAILIFYHGAINWSKLGLFAVGQGTVFPFWVPSFLRSYGCGTPNGALWSIFALVQFYVLAYPVYQLVHGKGLKHWIALLSGLIALSITFRYTKSYIPMNLSKMMAISFVPTFWMFMFGAFVSEYQDTILPMVLKFWYVPVVLRVVDMYFPIPGVPVFYYGCSHTIVLFLAVLAIGYKLPRLNIKTDISYGIYIYHMTVVNAMIALGFSGRGQWEILIVGAITCVISYCSTKTVGAYSKSLKAKFTRKEG